MESGESSERLKTAARLGLKRQCIARDTSSTDFDLEQSVDLRSDLTRSLNNLQLETSIHLYLHYSIKPFRQVSFRKPISP